MHREGLRAGVHRLSAIVAIKALNCDNACSMVLPPFYPDYIFELRSNCTYHNKGRKSAGNWTGSEFRASLVCRCLSLRENQRKKKESVATQSAVKLHYT